MTQFDIHVFMAGVRREAGELHLPRRSLRLIWHLLQLQGEVFLKIAYIQLLGREPDPAAVEGYQTRSRYTLGRLIIILSLLISPEQTRIPHWLRRGIAWLRG
ncbi:MAG: hypothetical protein IJU65_09725 [Desulfovibrio sp.]|nr:hypothetical protein [Desulfovibrio sp.]